MSESSKPVVTAVAEPRPDGEKITRAVLAFSGKIPNVDDIEVIGRTVVGRETDGSAVTLYLSEEDEAAVVLPQPQGVPDGTPPWELPERKRRPIEVEVRVPGCTETLRSSGARELVIEDFVQSRYKSFPYDLYTPKHMEVGKKYPLVMFIPDASVNGSDPLAALSQGTGATVWAEPGEQEKRPCYVLAIQVPKSVRLTMPGFQAGPGLEEVRELLDKIIAENQVDPDRVYATGQSQGCMAICELNCRYPDFFAASLLVAGQWDPEKVGKLTAAKFFIGLSEGGPREFPGMNAITEALAANGVEITRARMSFRDGFAVNDDKLRAVMAGAQVVYATFEEATAFPKNDVRARIPIAHHSRGWELTYQLEAAREWLFAQTRR